MPLSQYAGLINLRRIQCGAAVTSKKKSLQLAAELLQSAVPEPADDDDDEDNEIDVFDALTGRERIGCTGMGHGIAIPHGRVDYIDQPLGAVLVLDEPVNYDAPDGEPVDVIFALLMPEHQVDEHLNVLADLARFFNEESNRQLIRNAGSATEIFDILTHSGQASREGAAGA